MSKPRKPTKSSRKPAKKKAKDGVIPINLPVEVVDFYKVVAKRSGVSLNTVLKVVVMLEVTAELMREEEEKRNNAYHSGDYSEEE